MAGLCSIIPWWVPAAPSAVVKLRELMQSEVRPVESCLTEDRHGMKRAMLEVSYLSSGFTGISSCSLEHMSTMHCEPCWRELGGEHAWALEGY